MASYDSTFTLIEQPMAGAEDAVDTTQIGVMNYILKNIRNPEGGYSINDEIMVSRKSSIANKLIPYFKDLKGQAYRENSYIVSSGLKHFHTLYNGSPHYKYGRVMAPWVSLYRLWAGTSQYHHDLGLNNITNAMFDIWGMDRSEVENTILSQILDGSSDSFKELDSPVKYTIGGKVYTSREDIPSSVPESSIPDIPKFSDYSKSYDDYHTNPDLSNGTNEQMSWLDFGNLTRYVFTLYEEKSGGVTHTLDIRVSYRPSTGRWDYDVDYLNVYYQDPHSLGTPIGNTGLYMRNFDFGFVGALYTKTGEFALYSRSLRIPMTRWTLTGFTKEGHKIEYTFKKISKPLDKEYHHVVMANAIKVNQYESGFMPFDEYFFRYFKKEIQLETYYANNDMQYEKLVSMGNDGYDVGLWSDSIYNFNKKIQWTGHYRNLVNLKTLAQGDIVTYFGNTTTLNYVTNTLKVGGYYSNRSSPIKIFFHKISDNIIEVVRVRGLSTLYYFWFEESRSDANNSDLTIDIDMTVLADMDFKSVEQVLQRSMHIYIWHLKHTKRKWYQERGFLNVVKFVAIGINFVAPGAGSSLQAAIISAAKAYAVSVLIDVTIDVIIEVAKKLGVNADFLDSISGLLKVAANIAVANKFDFGSIKASDVLEITNAAFNSYSHYLAIQTQEVYKNMQDFAVTAKEKEDNLKEIQKLLETGIYSEGIEILSSPIQLRRSSNLYESPSEFYTRTTIVDVGPITMDYVKSFADITSSLPRAVPYRIVEDDPVESVLLLN